MAASADEILKATAIDAIATTGEPVTFIGAQGQIATRATIQEEADELAPPTGAIESRWFASMITADVGHPRIGDRIIRADGRRYLLESPRSTQREYVTEWYIRYA